MNTMDQLDAFRHYGYMLGVYSTKVGILEDPSQIMFSAFLEPLHCLYLET